MSDLETQRPRERKRMPGWAWALIGCFVGVPLLLIPVMAAILFPVFSQARTKARSITCLSNVKQQGLAMVMYAQDYDEQFPPAAKWIDATYPYTRNTTVYHCPEVKDRTSFGYAMNTALDGKKLKKIANPALEYLIFDSVAVERNAHGKTTDLLPSPERHPLSRGRGNVIGFADGHAKLTMQKQTP